MSTQVNTSVIELLKELGTVHSNWKEFFAEEVGMDPTAWLTDNEFQVVSSKGIDTSGMSQAQLKSACDERKAEVVRALITKAKDGDSTPVETTATESAVDTPTPEPAATEQPIDFAAEAKKKMEARKAKAEAETSNAKAEEQAKEIASLQANLFKVEEINGALSNSVKELEAKVANLEKVNTSIQEGMKVILEQL